MHYTRDSNLVVNADIIAGLKYLAFAIILANVMDVKTIYTS